MQATDIAEAKARLRGLAQRWRGQPWCARITATGPGPVAHEVSALAEVLDTGDAGGALLQLRDTVETLLKFLTLVMARDLIAHGTTADAAAARTALLSKPLSLGHWASATREFAQRIEKSHSVFLTGPLAKTLASLHSAINEFVRDRNDEIGHGAFRRNPNEAAQVVEDVTFGGRGGAAGIFAAFADTEWPRLHLLQSDEVIPLNGADAVQHWHERALPQGSEAEAVMSVRALFGARALDLSPFIAGRVCEWCHRQDIFLFDTVHDRKSGGRFDFLDYVQGHKMRRRDALLAEALAETHQDHAYSEAVASQGVLSQTAVDQIERAANDARYISPSYLREVLLTRIEAEPSSLTWLQAPAHIGKSVFARGLADPNAEVCDPLLPDEVAAAGVFIKREWRAELPLLRTRLVTALMRAFGLNEDYRDALPALTEDSSNKPAAFVALLARVRALGASLDPIKRRLLLVIDGLDELAPTSAGLAFTDFLPSAAELPEGVHVLLTSRRPGDPDCPAWIASRLVPRFKMKDTLVQRVGLDDPGYIALMKAYTVQMLHHDLTDGEFRLLLKKADGRFLYLSFLVEQMALGRIARDEVENQPSGEGLLLRFLSDLKRDLGGKRLADEAELLLLALAAEELAHNWAFGEGLTYDQPGEPVLVGDPEWRGVDLNSLAAGLDRVRPDGKPEGLLLYAVFRLKAAIGIHRGGAGQALFRLWLKGFASVMAGDAAWSQRLRALHVRTALRLADVAVQAAAAPPKAQQELLAAWSQMLPRGLAHAVLSGSETVLQRVRDDDEVLSASIERSFLTRQDASKSQDSESTFAANAAIALLLHRARMRALNEKIAHEQDQGQFTVIIGRHRPAATISDLAGEEFGIRIRDSAVPHSDGSNYTVNGLTSYELDRTAVALTSRAMARLENGHVPGALLDLDRAIRILRNLRRVSEMLKIHFPVVGLVDLAAAHRARGEARSAAGNPYGAILDENEAIRLLASLHEQRAEKTDPDYSKQYYRAREERSKALTTRGVARGQSGDIVRGVEDFQQAIGLLADLQSRPARVTAYSLELGHYGGLALSAMGMHNESVELLEGMRQALGSAFTPAWEYRLAATLIRRGAANDFARDFQGALVDYTTAVRLFTGLQERLGSALPAPWQNELANALMKRGCTYGTIRRPRDALPDFSKAIELRVELWERLEVNFSPFWMNDLATAYMNRGRAYREVQDAPTAMSDLNESVRVADLALHRLMPHPPDDCLEVWVQARRSRADLRSGYGDLHGAAVDRAVVAARLDAMKRRFPPPLMPGRPEEVSFSAVKQLSKTLMPAVGADLAPRSVVAAGWRQMGPGNTSLVTVVLDQPKFLPGAVDVVVQSNGQISLLSSWSVTELLNALQLRIDTETAKLWVALSLAGPWADFPRRIVESADDIPWRGPAAPSSLPMISGMRTTHNFEGFEVEATWTRGTTLVAGAVQVSKTGATNIVRETVLAEQLAILDWAYDGTVRIAI